MNVYKELLNALKTTFKDDFKTVALQRNQIQNTTTENPLLLPALYIDTGDLAWQSETHHLQTSRATITLQIVCTSLDTPDDTLFSLAQSVFQKLHNTQIKNPSGRDITSRWERTASRNVADYNALKVFEMDFDGVIFDASLQPVTAAIPPPRGDVQTA